MLTRRKEGTQSVLVKVTKITSRASCHKNLVTLIMTTHFPTNESMFPSAIGKLYLQNVCNPGGERATIEFQRFSPNMVHQPTNQPARERYRRRTSKAFSSARISSSTFVHPSVSSIVQAKNPDHFYNRIGKISRISKISKICKVNRTGVYYLCTGVFLK